VAAFASASEAPRYQTELSEVRRVLLKDGALGAINSDVEDG
jgi:hypothetical protein